VRRETIVPTAIAVAGVIAIAYLLSAPQVGNLQMVVSGLLLVLYVGATLLRPTLGLILISATLPFLGMLRRILYQASPVGFDALLLVIPLYSAFMLLVIAVTYRPKLAALWRASVTSRLLLVLMAILALQIVNPLQGGLAVGVAGALFYLVPLSWFFIGWVFLTEQAAKSVLALFVVASIIAAGYGLMQTFVGFPSFDAYWIAHAGYAALKVGGTVRAIGPATSAAEYAAFLSAGLACMLALVVFRWQLLVLVPAGLIGVALILESSRTVIVEILAVFVALLVLRQRSKPFAIVVIGVLCVLIAFVYQDFSPTVYAGPQDTSSPMQGLLAHQINGLAHPFDPRYSTGQGHLQQIIGALATSFGNPLGFGLGATTLAAYKFGGSVVSGELDIPNVFLSGGVIAGFLFAFILYRTFRTGVTLAFRYKRTVDVLAFATVAVTFGQILNGAHYSLMPFIWMFIAWIDRRATDDRTTDWASARQTGVLRVGLLKPSMAVVE
jgi:uncharacterized MnhB-related membrane protein